MRHEWQAWVVAAALAAVPPALEAQSAAPTDTKSSQSNAQSEAGEPRASTSPDAVTSGAGQGGSGQSSAGQSMGQNGAGEGGAGQRGAPQSGDAAAAKATQGAASGPASHSRASAAGKATSGTTAGAASSSASAGTSGKSGAADRLELGTATVTGDREQPKVMYIVPWKKSDIGDLSGKPMNSLLDEALAPIDREEFKRQVVYYQAVRSDAAQNGAAKTPAQGEK
jgi:hypothetical protein